MIYLDLNDFKDSMMRIIVQWKLNTFPHFPALENAGFFNPKGSKPWVASKLFQKPVKA
ncbi:MAG: hypothetical protein IPL27_05650 [Lewinellaceae bacterium]|nr:hypothetical protein [Lewinellaceae bacterium]